MIAPHPLAIPATLSTNSPPESMLIPSIFATWLTMMSRARPPTNPTRIGFDRKFARNPNRSTARSTNITEASRSGIVMSRGTFLSRISS